MDTTHVTADKLIDKLIPKIMGEVGSIGKSRRGQGINYSFRGIDDVYLALQGPLAENGVYYMPHVLEIKREERETKSGGVMTVTLLTVKYTFFATDGSSREAIVIGEALDTSDKSCNKAMSAALKLACLQIFCIPTEEPKDTEEESHDMPPRPPGNTVPTGNTVGYDARHNAKMEEFISQKQIGLMMFKANEAGWSEEDVKAYWNKLGVKTRKEVKKFQLDYFLEMLLKYPKVKEADFDEPPPEAA